MISQEDALRIMLMMRFQIEADAPPQVVAERLRAATRPQPKFSEYVSRIWKPIAQGAPPFVGTVVGDSFRLRREIRGRNSFIPIIRGRIVLTDHGARVIGVMFLHPLTAAFMAFVLGVTGYGALTDNSITRVAPLGMFVFCIALTLGSFFPEVSRAKLLLRAAVNRDLTDKETAQSNH